MFFFWSFFSSVLALFYFEITIVRHSLLESSDLCQLSYSIKFRHIRKIRMNYDQDGYGCHLENIIYYKWNQEKVIVLSRSAVNVFPYLYNECTYDWRFLLGWTFKEILEKVSSRNIHNIITMIFSIWICDMTSKSVYRVLPFKNRNSSATCRWLIFQIGVLLYIFLYLITCIHLRQFLQKTSNHRTRVKSYVSSHGIKKIRV